MGQAAGGHVMSKSLFSDERECWLCHSPEVHKHHVYPGNGRRQISEREGCWLYLCPAHHNMGEFGVHFDRQLDLAIRQECQRRWMESNEATADEFREIFGCSYL